MNWGGALLNIAAVMSGYNKAQKKKEESQAGTFIPKEVQQSETFKGFMDSLPDSSKPKMSEMKQSNMSIKSVVDAANQTYGVGTPMAKLAAAQAVHESGMLSGKPSQLASKYNNYFGIKGSGSGGSVELPTNEEINGRMVRMPQGFSRNLSVNDSFAQHRNLMNKPRYRSVLQSSSLEDAARAVQQNGYATDSRYSSKLMDVYNNHLSPYF